MATIQVRSDVLLVVGGTAIGAGVLYYMMQLQQKIDAIGADKARGLVPAAQYIETAQPVAFNQDDIQKITRRNSSQVPSMEDALKQHEETGAALADTTPRGVLQALQQGNARFWMGLAQRPERSAMERRAMIMQQFPKAAILGCSDSRVPIEIVFDQGLGDIFTIRVAGNSVGSGVAASIDYAVAHLKVKVVVVMGHEGCGAVRAAMLPQDKIDGESRNLSWWLTTMKKNLEGHSAISRINDLRARDREAVMTNVRAQMVTIARDPLVASRIMEGSLLVVGAFYEISSGMVDFLDLPVEYEELLTCLSK
jgi:carbonic anhydrase